MTFFPGTHPLTWSCHVCKEERPDAKISVLTREKTLVGLPFSENVRYCNDRLACIEGAHTVSFVKGDEDGE